MQGIAIWHILAVIDRHLTDYPNRHYSGSGDALFSWVGQVIRETLPGRSPQGDFRSALWNSQEIGRQGFQLRSGPCGPAHRVRFSMDLQVLLFLYSLNRLILRFSQKLSKLGWFHVRFRCTTCITILECRQVLGAQNDRRHRQVPTVVGSGFCRAFESCCHRYLLRRAGRFVDGRYLGRLHAPEHFSE